MPEDLIAGHLTPWRVWHRGADRPVLALHCSLAHAGAWSGLVEQLHGVTVTALDQPSHGRSADWDGVQDLHGLTTRISIAMAEMVGLGEPVDLIGHSFGGTVALRIAMERPELVRSLTLVEPVIFAAARSAEAPEYAAFRAEHLEFARLIKAGDREAGARLFHAIWGTGNGFDDLPEGQRRYILDRIHLIVAQNPVLLDDAAGLLSYMRLESIGVPVLLVEGADSPPIINAVQTELARRLTQVTRLVVPGAGHMVPITHPAVVAEAVTAHLAGC
ncbi:MAG: alpha/beta fold hydrolase, partial [Paracoccaceae bacterium]